MKALVLHGPNLDLLGRRNVAVYGSDTLEQIDRAIVAEGAEIGFEVESHQTAREGEIIELLVSGIDRVAGCLLNPGAYAHTSRAIADAIDAVPFPVIEVHISNIHAREPWRAESVTARAARALVSGFGPTSYLIARRGLRMVIEADARQPG